MSQKEGFSENALRILKARYFMKDEKGRLLDKKPSHLFRRVADAVAEAESTEENRKSWAGRFYSLMMDRDFLPNSPTLTGAGRGLCLSACFVLPIEDSMESIFETVKNTALVHKEGGGTGRTRPSSPPGPEVLPRDQPGIPPDKPAYSRSFQIRAPSWQSFCTRSS